MRQRTEYSVAVAALLFAIFLIFASFCTSCIKDDGTKKFDQCEALNVAKGAHNVATGASLIVCSAIADPAKKAKCYKYQQQASAIGQAIVGLGIDLLKACVVR